MVIVAPGHFTVKQTHYTTFNWHSKSLFEILEISCFMVRCHKISKDFQRDMKIVIAYCYLDLKSAKTVKIVGHSR